MLNPFLYVKRYHELWTPQFMSWFNDGGFYGVGAIHTPVKEYCNNRYTNAAGNTPSERLKFKDALLRFFKARAKEDDTGINYAKGDGFSLSSSYTVKPIYDFPSASFMASFCGKSSPEALGDMIQFISYWRYWQINKKNKSVAPMPFIVSDYLGVDCNGFIGNYLRAKYAGNSLGPSSTEYTYHRKGKKTRRTRFRDIRMDDVIVFSGYHHVAIIQELIDWGEDWAVVEVCESRSKNHGGPQWSNEEITWQKKYGKEQPGKFRMRGENLASISDVRYA
jgi:hypothetical protein